MQVGAPAQDDGLSSPPRGVFKIWRGAAPSVVESITIHDDANEAAKFFTKSDPREFALDLLPPDDLVGESVPYPAAGAPDSSQIYCSPFHAIGSAECDSWTWWARYGQYTIELRAGSGPSQRTIDRAEFEQIVDLAAAHIAQTVGP